MQLSLKYPQAGAAPTIIDVRLYDERQLLAAEGNTYPLIIRLEAISDSGKAENHTLQVSAAGLATAAQIMPSDCFRRTARQDAVWGHCECYLKLGV
jgi:hypothetical protein